MKINVLDRNGRFIEVIDYVRVPLPIMFPGEHIVKINWDDGEPIGPDDLRKPIRHMGKDYYAFYGAGSDAKERMTWGLQRDLLDGTARYVEDVTRFGRWAMAQGHFGQYSGAFTITSLPAGHKIAGASVEDGCGYVRRSLAEKMLRRRKKIKFRIPRVGWMFWQRLDWGIISGLAEPLCEDMCSRAADPEQIMYIAPKGFEYKAKLFETNKDMIEHPYIARSIARTSQDRYARLSHSVHIPGEYKLIVPSNLQLCWPGHHGKIVAVRSPIDSNSSIQAVDADYDPDEEARISSLEAMQVSISKQGFFSKGLLVIAEDNELPADVVVCEADVKMGPQPDGHMDAAITVIQAWEPGQCVGVGSDWGGRYVGDVFGNDWDGDALELHDCNDILEPVWIAASVLEEAETPKIRKTKHKLSDGDLRPEMLSVIMYNLVGFATNLHARTFATTNREWVAYSLGFDSVAEMDQRFNRAIKLGTDITKNYVDPEETIRWLNVTQANLNRMGLDAPWTSWDDEDWTRQGMPVVISREEGGVDDTRYFYEKDGIELETNMDVVHRSIHEYMDGTCAQIARVALPILINSFGNIVPVRPLSFFKSYVDMPPKADIEIAEQIMTWWNARVSRVNFEDPSKAKVLALQLEDFVLGLQIKDNDAIARALWWLSHGVRNTTENTAAVVFTAFPDECLSIVAPREDEGKNSGEIVYTMLVGVGRQVPNGLDGVFDIRAERILYQGITRMVLCGEVSGQIAPADNDLPRDMLGFVAKNEPQPDPGKYRATILPFQGASWTAKLVK